MYSADLGQGLGLGSCLGTCLWAISSSYFYSFHFIIHVAPHGVAVVTAFSLSSGTTTPVGDVVECTHLHVDNLSPIPRQTSHLHSTQQRHDMYCIYKMKVGGNYIWWNAIRIFSGICVSNQMTKLHVIVTTAENPIAGQVFILCSDSDAPPTPLAPEPVWYPYYIIKGVIACSPGFQ